MAARPARLGLLVEAELKGVHWLRMFEGALAAQSRFWGGRGNLLFPLTKDFGSHELFWALADIFDADAFVTYAPTWREMENIDPTTFEQQIASWRGHISDRTGREEAERFISTALGEAAYHPDVSQEELTLLRKRLSPLSHPGGDDGPLEWFDGSNSARWPFTDISDFESLPEQFSIPVTPDSGVTRKLLLTSLYGRTPDTLENALRERDINSVEQNVDKYEIYGMLRGRKTTDLPGPWDLSMTGLSTFYTTGSFLRLPAALVVGNSPWDFALFYALLRLTGRAWWLPSWLRRDPSYLMSLESSIRFDPQNEGRKAVVVSTSSFNMRNEVAQTLLSLQGEQLDVADWRDVLPENPMRVLASDTSGRARILPLADGRVLELDTPIPTIARTERPAEMRWLSEVRSAQWAPVRNRILGEQLLGAGSDITRTSRDGLAYFSTSSFILSGASLESVVVRPSLRPLPLAEQVQALLQKKGWTCGVSDKAVYALESMKLFGGFDKLCKALLDPSVRTILDAYRSKRGPGARLSSDHRRYLTYVHFEQLLDTEDARSVVEPMLDRQVLVRGAVFKCVRCRQAAWHSAASPPDQFVCERCGLRQEANREAWFGTAEPVLSYRLAEVIFQLFEHHGELPLLAASEAFGNSKRPLGRGYELTVGPPAGKEQEVDIFQSDGYRLWIGEASIKPKLDTGRLEFLAELANVLDAYGILLATSGSQWSAVTEEHARRIFPGPWPRLRLMTGVQTTPGDDLETTK